MSRIGDRIHGARDWIDGRELRERVLLLAAVVVVLFLVWDIGIRAPIAQRADIAADRVERLEREQADLRASAGELESSLAGLQGDSADNDTGRLRAAIDDIDSDLAERTARVVSPAQMVAVVRDMVAADEALTLEALTNRGAEEIVTDDFDEGIPRVYRHRVEVVASGDYFAVLDYLRRLEDLDWQFQWDGLRIETVRYPTARVTIRLSTLSLDEDWIGV